MMGTGTGFQKVVFLRRFQKSKLTLSDKIHLKADNWEK